MQLSNSTLFPQIESGVCVSKIIHHAVIEVNEKGGSAPPASEVEGEGTSAPPKVEAPIKFFLDRPFCFWIGTRKNILSFAGICADPLVIVEPQSNKSSESK